MRRRTCLQILAASPALARPQQPPGPAPERITKDKLAPALDLLGLEFSEPHRDLMLPAVNRALQRYEALRQIPIPLDTEPAIRFSPLLPGARLPARPASLRSARTRPPRRAARSWKSVEELAFLPAAELAPLVRSRLVSSTDLTKMYLDRLKRFGPKLNCVITLTEDLALAQAARADREIRAGRYRGPLHGIPWGAKDLFATKGIPTTWGGEPYRNQVPDYDATVVERLDKAGAVLLAKLSMGALAQGGLWFGGMTKTPWNIEQSSSGSSAGSASATAAGLVGFSLGTETLGSIISPSIRCGTVGLRPTFGRVSRHGAMALCWTMDKVGPICRSVEDAALVLQAIQGPDGRDLNVVDAPFHWDPALPLDRLRAGLLHRDFEKLEGEEKAICDKALDDLRRAGVKLEPAELPAFSADPLRIILNAEAAAAFDDLTRDGGVHQLRGQAPGDWPNSFRTARLIPAVEYLRASRARTLLLRRMEQFMSSWDVLVGRSGPSLAVTNFTGHPQAVVPCGFLKGLPQGLVFTGRLYQEDSLLRAALAFEQATGWHNMHPALA